MLVNPEADQLQQTVEGMPWPDLHHGVDDIRYTNKVTATDLHCYPICMVTH